MQISRETSTMALSTLLRIARNMPVSSRALWHSRISHVYGDMKGQRAVDLTGLAQSLGVVEVYGDLAVDTVVALESFFFLVCNLIAYASFQKDPSGFLRRLDSYPAQRFSSFLDRLVSGALFEDEGVYGCRSGVDFDWMVEGCTGHDLLAVRSALSSIASVWDGDRLTIPGLDPLQDIHHSLFPKNLLHITGQFYTPEWLAELLLSDIEWSPTERLIDPFCGSGVFLIRALERARLDGATVNEVLPNLLGIDLNPIACAATRSNLALYIGRQRRKLECSVHLNVLSADSLAPAITKGHSRSSPLIPSGRSASIDGEKVGLPDLRSHDASSQIASRLADYGLGLDKWIDSSPTVEKPGTPEKLSARDRRIWEQLCVYVLRPADVVVTNPPWVGWEYISRPYRDTITDAWRLYDLFKVRGLEAAFLKEDISSLALMVAWDFFLREGGLSAVVMRRAAMHSGLAARGVRRLSLADDGVALNLRHVRTFSNIRVFREASTEVATWEIRKGEPTAFPVEVTEWSKNARGWNPETYAELDAIIPKIRSEAKQAIRTEPEDVESRWLIAEPKTLETFRRLGGENNYVPRIGVFTGGANAVFYLQRLGPGDTRDTSLYRNIIARAKRLVPERKVPLEHGVVFSVVRGRDIHTWHSEPEVYLLCPHSRETRIYPLEEAELRSKYPLAYQYLLSVRGVLAERQGFAGWEKKVLERYFYALQRVGEYTFSPYKVCWRYIASEFTVCVINGDDYAKPILPNDKVMFIPFESSRAAYFLCGVLSSTPVRRYIDSSASKRHVSASVIKSLALPEFDESNGLHLEISSACMRGHLATSDDDAEQLKVLREQLDVQVGSLFGL